MLPLVSANLSSLHLKKFPHLCALHLPPARYHHKYLQMMACKRGRHSKSHVGFTCAAHRLVNLRSPANPSKAGRCCLQRPPPQRRRRQAMGAQLGLRPPSVQHCSGGCRACQVGSSTKSTSGHPELSKDGVPQLAGDTRLRACSLLATRELASCSTETAFQTASSKPRKKGIIFFRLQ